MPQKKSKQTENAFVISEYYGFEGLEIDPINRDLTEKVKRIKKDNDKIEHPHLPRIEECVSILEKCHGDENKNKTFPLLYYTKGEMKDGRRTPKYSGKTVGLHIIGTPKSIAEAILIKTACAILEEEGYKDLSVEINSLGNKESLALFSKELNAYMRSKVSELDVECKEVLKCGGHTLVSMNPKGLPEKILNESPSSIEFLSEGSRNHFKEVIEYMESQSIPYEINKNILGDPHYSTNTVFTILDKKTGKILATGTRYNELSKRTLSRKGHPGVSLNIRLPKLKKVSESKKPKFNKSDIFFIQLGYSAKLKSLEVIERLRKANIPVHQSIGRDKMATQTAFAQKKGAKYILLMGQKEANENSVCVRDLESNNQTTIPLENLVEHLKKLRKKNKN